MTVTSGVRTSVFAYVTESPEYRASRAVFAGTFFAELTPAEVTARLEAAGVSAAALDAIDEEVRSAVAAAEAESREAPEPSPDVLETQVWADGGSAWRN